METGAIRRRSGHWRTKAVPAMRFETIFIPSLFVAQLLAGAMRGANGLPIFRFCIQALEQCNYYGHPVTFCPIACHVYNLCRAATMQNLTFEHDPYSRKATRYFLWLQLVTMMASLGLIYLRLQSLALVLTLLTLLQSGALLLWLYRRYQSLPLIREKYKLRQQAIHIQEKVAGVQQSLTRIRQDREHILRKEQFGLEATLLNQQTYHIQKALSSCSIRDAIISGVEAKLKERLAEAGILTALDVTEHAVSQVPGVGAAKRAALMDWRSMLYAQFDATKPVRLPGNQLTYIQKKFQRLHAHLDEKEKAAADQLLQVVVELDATQQQLKRLAPVTFLGYLRHALASKG